MGAVCDERGPVKGVAVARVLEHCELGPAEHPNGRKAVCLSKRVKADHQFGGRGAVDLPLRGDDKRDAGTEDRASRSEHALAPDDLFGAGLTRGEYNKAKPREIMCGDL